MTFTKKIHFAALRIFFSGLPGLLPPPHPHTSLLHDRFLLSRSMVSRPRLNLFSGQKLLPVVDAPLYTRVESPVVALCDQKLKM